MKSLYCLSLRAKRSNLLKTVFRGDCFVAPPLAALLAMTAALALLFFPLQLHAAPKRIVSLKPNITDIVYALGLGEELKGVTRYCDVPKGFKKPKIAGDYTQPYIETIIALAPDIVLGSEENSSRSSIERLRSVGIKVSLFKFSTVPEMAESIRAIGKELGVPEKANALANGVMKDLDSLKERYANTKTKRAVVIWGIRPIVAAGRGTYMDELLEIINVANAVRGDKTKYPRIGIEELISINPDVMIDLAMGSEAGDDSQVTRPWSGIDTIKAVHDGHVIRLDAGKFRAGPHITKALEELAKLVH